MARASRRGRQAFSVLPGRRADVDDAAQELGQVKLCRLNLQLASLDLRQVEDVIDEGEQMFAAARDDLNGTTMGFGQGVVALEGSGHSRGCH